jgi:hypothetical protein
LPTGNSSKDLGSGSFGYQVLLPFSKIVSDRVTVHANVGVTSYFDVKDQHPTTYLVGASAIYAVTREFNLTLEATNEWAESVSAAGDIERERRFTLSPGIRYAFNFPRADGAPTQVVLGVGAPIHFTSGATDYGALLYLSLEHDFLK